MWNNFSTFAAHLGAKDSGHDCSLVPRVGHTRLTPPNSNMDKVNGDQDSRYTPTRWQTCTSYLELTQVTRRAWLAGKLNRFHPIEEGCISLVGPISLAVV